MDEAMLMQRCQELGEQISREYEGKTPLLVGVLNGAMVFMSAPGHVKSLSRAADSHEFSS